MKTLQLAMIITLSLLIIFLVTSQHASAYTCSEKLTSYNAPQFYLLSDGVFAGTVQHIDNTTDHQWKVYFTVDKLWRGSISQKPLMVMTNSLQGCGYSIVQGEKYLVYTNGYPPFFNTVWSKPYADAQSDIAIIDDPKFQSDEKTQEELNKKLVIARDAISNLMGSKMGTIPFNSVGVDVINSTLDIGIDSAKAVLSEEEYEKKIRDIVGDIPIKITFGQIFTNAPIVDILSAKNSVSLPLSPLQQFKSGVAANDIKCEQGLQLVVKAEDNSPSCVKSQTAQKLVERGWGWAMQPIDSIKPLLPNRIAGLENDTGIVTFGNRTYYFETPHYTQDAYVNPVQISFHDVIFTLFPSGFRGGLPIPCTNNPEKLQYYWTDAKFADGTHELLHILGDSPPCPTRPIPTMFSTHTNPQAGLTFYNGKMKLLVSINVVNSTANGPEFKVGQDLLGPIPHQLVFFMKSNSTAKIFVEYTSHEPNTGTMPSYSRVYVGKGGNYTPLTTSDVSINAEPSSIPLTEGSDTIVVYNITAKEGVKGVYWIFLAQFCRVMPLAIDINSLTISPFDIPVQTGAMSCPAQVLYGKILGISEGNAEYKVGQPVK